MIAAAPVAVSLVVHGALAAGVVALLAVAGGVPRLPERVVPVRRAPEPAPARLLLEEVPDPGFAAVPLDSDDPRYRPYLQGVRSRIVARWEAPPAAAAAGAPVVEFLIARDGALAGAELAAGSGAAALDRAALAAVRGAAPFPPFPPGLERERLRVRARFVP